MLHIIIGTKAQLIKMAPIMSSLQQKKIDYNYIFTGQHSESMKEISHNFSLKEPDVILFNQGDTTNTKSILKWFVKTLFSSLLSRKEIFKNDERGIALVHGDTLSTLLGAIIAKTQGIKVAHVESGLRSFNILQPFPEELTRLIVFQLSDVFFCQNQTAIDNLKKYKGLKYNTQQNTLYDSLKIYLEINNEAHTDQQKPYAIVTLHRFENIRSKKAMERVVNIIEDISKKITLFFILHKPTKESLIKHNLFEKLESNDNIILHPRYNFFNFIDLVRQAEFLISDGGSNQEECFYLGKPILLLRKATERDEGLGINAVLSNYDSKIINHFINNINNYKKNLFISRASPSEIIINECIKISK